MLSFKEAQDTLRYYGFKSKSVEPILVEKGKDIGIFSTFKTKYGRLSRFITFKEKEELEKFLKEYIKYQNAIDNEDTIVKFDNYEKLSPNVKFTIGKKIEIPEDVEELEINTTDDVSMKLLNVVLDEAKKELEVIGDTQEKLQNIVKEYLQELGDLNKKMGKESDQMPANVNLTDINAYDDEIEKIRKNTMIDDNEKFMDNFDKALNVYERILSDNIYLDNLYLTECYNEELRRTKEMLKHYYNYITNRNRLFRGAKDATFEEYLKLNPVDEKIVDQDELIKKHNEEVTKKLDVFKNTSIDELKKKYGQTKEINPEEVLGDYKFDLKELSRYYKKLSDKEKTSVLLFSSPLKEFVVILKQLVIVLKSMGIDKLDEALKEKKFLNMCKESYNVVSNEENYPIVKKCFPKLKLDSIEEFINSLLDCGEDLDTSTLKLNTGIELRYKMGRPIKKGFINASLTENYPVNNKGANTYYIVTLKTKLPIYYSNKILKLNPDGELELSKNEDVITFSMNNYKLTRRRDTKVKDYVYKKNDFVLFNEKRYISCELENGDK